MPDTSKVDAKEALKQLAKSLALTLPVVLLRTALIVLGFAVANLAFTTIIFAYAARGSHGPGAAILFLLVAIPFAPFFIVAFILAHKQGATRLVAAAVESQGPTLAVVGEHALSAYLRDKDATDPNTVREALGRGWQRYLKTRSALPWPVRLVLSSVFARIAITEIIDDLAAKGTSKEDFPREFMSRVIQLAAQTFLRPSLKPVLILLLVNAVWFVILLAKVRMT